MSASKRIAIVLAAGLLGWCALGVGEQLAVTGTPALVSPAHAVVGRPLTPVSVAGVARRTVRRCAVGVYNC